MHLKVEPLNSWANKPPATILSVGALPAACGQYSRARGPLTGLKNHPVPPCPDFSRRLRPFESHGWAERWTVPRISGYSAAFRSRWRLLVSLGTDSHPRTRTLRISGHPAPCFGLIRSRPLGRAVSSTAAHASSWHPGVSSQRWTAAVACALLDVSCIMPAAPRYHVRSAQGPENLHDES